MADQRGFIKHPERELPQRRPVPLRLMDWKEVYEDFDKDTLKTQASRCMDCGIPFCHNGCPLEQYMYWLKWARQQRIA